MGVERHAVRDLLERSETAPYRHQEEEAQINERANLRHQVKDIRRRLGAEVAQDDEVDEEDSVQHLVPARTVAARSQKSWRLPIPGA